jgi:hypothetical protein
MGPSRAGRGAINKKRKALFFKRKRDILKNGRFCNS